MTKISLLTMTEVYSFPKTVQKISEYSVKSEHLVNKFAVH